MIDHNLIAYKYMLTTQQGYEDINKNSEKKAEVLIRPKKICWFWVKFYRSFSAVLVYTALYRSRL